MIASLSAWVRKLRPEDPRRIRKFRDRMAGVSWDKASLVESLSQLFEAVDDLAEAEVKYYYRRRGTRASLSGLFRILAWVLGSIGLLLPLLSATDQPALKPLGQYGYSFLAAAASFLAANSLFGGTSGHIRFVSTQLELEKLITTSRVSWCEFLAMLHSTELSDAEIKGGFTLIQEYSQGLYAKTIAETGNWGETLLAELVKYQKTVGDGSTAGMKPK